MADFRRAMEPLTATNLQVRKRNKVQDFVNVAGPLGVTQMVVFTATELGTYMRVARLPHGPTLTYKIKEYALVGDIGQVQQRPTTTNSMEFLHSPLVVLSNFSAPPGVDEAAHRHVKLAGVMFQNLFPTLNVDTIKLRDARRVVLANYDTDSGSIEWRHYSVTTREKGLSKGVRKILEPGADMPDLSRLNDISELLGGDGGDGSDSEAEGESGNTVTMERKKRRNLKRKHAAAAAASGPQQQALRLREIGPRLTLDLVKVEKDIMKGDVLYHRHVTKTPEEILALKEAKAASESLKAERKRIQDSNVGRKKAVEDKKKLKKKDRRDRQKAAAGDESDSSGTDTEAGDVGGYGMDRVHDYDDDDEAYYKEEVGEAAEAGTFSTNKRPKHDSHDDEKRVEKLLKHGSDLKKLDKTGKVMRDGSGLLVKPKAKVHPFGNPSMVAREEKRKAGKKAKLAVKLQERSEAKKNASKGDGSGSWKSRSGDGGGDSWTKKDDASFNKGSRGGGGGGSSGGSSKGASKERGGKGGGGQGSKGGGGKRGDSSSKN